MRIKSKTECWLKTACAIVGFSTLLSGCGAPAAVEEQYDGVWSGPTTDVMGALIRNNVTGCGEFYQQENRQHSNEFIVACHLGDGDWALYQVWPRIDQVQRLSISESARIGGLPDFTE